MRLDNEGKLVDGKIHSFIQPYHTGPRVDKNNAVAKAIRNLTQKDFTNPHILIDDDGSFHPIE